ncbi:MAG: hypothetical protein ACXVSJ_06265 [Solirubrobacteraceae bacterium]
MRAAGTPPAGPGGLGGGRGATRLTANFPPIEDAKANFFGVHGNVVSGAIAPVAGGGPTTLLELTDAHIVVSAAVGTDSATEVIVDNGTDVPLQAAQDLDGTAASISLAASAAKTIRLPGAGSGVHRLHLQILPNPPQFPDVVTLLVTAGDGAIAGQAFVTAIE